MHSVLQLQKGGGAPCASAVAGTEASTGTLSACIGLFFVYPTLDAPCVEGRVGGDAPGASAMAGTEVSIGTLWASRVLPRSGGPVRWEAGCDMSGTTKSVCFRLYSRNVAFHGSGGGGGVVAFTVVSLQSHHLSLKTTYTTK